MARVVNVGVQSFEDMRVNDDFLVDKTSFIGQWWCARDTMTVVLRPRRFGKTLTLSMVERFLSNRYDRRETERLFSGLDVSCDERMMGIMGTVPVVFLSLAGVKQATVEGAKQHIKQLLRAAVENHDYLMDSEKISPSRRRFLERVTDDMDDVTAVTCLGELCRMLELHWDAKPVVLLDEYDTPLVRAWEYGYFDEMVVFVGALFTSTFKVNLSLGRGLITGITRVAQESIFSDMNNPKVITTTTHKYETSFGFTEAEVVSALEEFSMADRLDEVRAWYDGFTFGNTSGMYNPWSITNLLDEGEFDAYWANTSSNALASEAVRMNPDVMSAFEELLSGGTITADVDGSVSFRDLGHHESGVWSLLLAAGYLRVVRRVPVSAGVHARGRRVRVGRYVLALTNLEVEALFQDLVEDWFSDAGEGVLGSFARALVAGDERIVQDRLSFVSERCVSSFDSGKKPSEHAHPERFWHGLVLGMSVELIDVGYDVRSNLESGYGRLDVMVVSNDPAGRASVVEFKMADEKSGDLEAACEDALDQIDRKGYVTAIVSRGIAPERISCYGIAFHSKNVLVRKA